MVARLPPVGEPPRNDTWQAWPVSWSAGWLGALTAVASLIVIGLIGVAVGAHLVGPSSRILCWRDFGLLALIFSIAGAFFSFVAGGWVAGKVAGVWRAETAMLHGAVTWLLAVPLLVFMIAWSGSSMFGSWYGGLAGSPAWTQSQAPTANPTPDNEATHRAAEETARATRNSALGALTSLLLGLVGSVIGGWMASGEPMTFGHYFRGSTTAGRTATAPNAALTNS